MKQKVFVPGNLKIYPIYIFADCLITFKKIFQCSLYVKYTDIMMIFNDKNS